VFIVTESNSSILHHVSIITAFLSSGSTFFVYVVFEIVYLKKKIINSILGCCFEF